MLPNPDSELAQDLVWSKAKRHMHGANEGMFFRVSEARKDDPSITKESLSGGWIHSIREIEEELKISYNGCHQYDWVRPRKTWQDAHRPVYLDFGDELLVKLEIYDLSGLNCVRVVSKRKFVHDVMVETNAKDIATHFYPISTNQP
jgi:competence protein CoiA